MRTDAYTRIVLTVIAVLRGWIAFNGQTVARAQDQKTFRVVTMGKPHTGADPEAILDKYARSGKAGGVHLNRLSTRSSRSSERDR